MKKILSFIIFMAVSCLTFADNKFGFYFINQEATQEYKKAFYEDSQEKMEDVKNKYYDCDFLEVTDLDGNFINVCAVKNDVIIPGESISSITVTNEDGLVEVNLFFDILSEKRFYNITKNNIGEYIATVIDNKVISQAKVTQALSGGLTMSGGHINIENAYKYKEAFETNSLGDYTETTENSEKGTIGNLIY